jgi:hypothetical protein
MKHLKQKKFIKVPLTFNVYVELNFTVELHYGDINKYAKMKINNMKKIK